MSTVSCVPLQEGKELHSGSKYEIHGGGGSIRKLPVIPIRDTFSAWGDVLPLGSEDLLSLVWTISTNEQVCSSAAVLNLPDPRLCF